MRHGNEAQDDACHRGTNKVRKLLRRVAGRNGNLGGNFEVIGSWAFKNMMKT